MRSDLAPEKLLAAYAMGIFPMADERGEIQWVLPDPRAIIELDAFKVSRSLRAVTRRGVFEVTVNSAFDSVITACADRDEGTWISDEIKDAYRLLHRLGFCHSVEAWSDGRLAGGLYGVALGGAFFGESMFHHVSDASKVALVHLVGRMRSRGYVLLDVQFLTEHLRRLGAVEVPCSEYERRLQQALTLTCCFADAPADSPNRTPPDGDQTTHE
jgi:leucyl/phenylalanyl-tRNA--protein transferase